MTADGELYITGECQETFEEELNRAFAGDKSVENPKLDSSDFSDYWGMKNFPPVVNIGILNEKNREKIGIAEISSVASIEWNGCERCIEINPEKIKITPLKEMTTLCPEEIDAFISSIAQLWKEEPLDGDATEQISKRILEKLDKINGNER